MDVAIIKYNAGNIYSVVSALRRLGVEPVLTDDAERLASADRILFPGQGEAATTMAYLRARRLDEVIRSLRQPVLGICIGQQLLCRHSEEGDTDCIGVFPVDVCRFRPRAHGDKVPAMGWNTLRPLQREAPLLSGITEQDWVYFVHSYYVPVSEWTTASADYILPYAATMQRGNFHTAQFHPEKSGKTGQRIIENFLKIKS